MLMNAMKENKGSGTVSLGTRVRLGNQRIPPWGGGLLRGTTNEGRGQPDGEKGRAFSGTELSRHRAGRRPGSFGDLEGTQTFGERWARVGAAPLPGGRLG